MRKRIPSMGISVPKAHLVMLLLRVVHLMMRHRVLLLLLGVMMLLLLLHLYQHRRRQHLRRRRRNTRIPKLNTTVLILYVHPSCVPSSILLLLLPIHRAHPKLIAILFLFLTTDHKHLHLSTYHHPKSFPSAWLLDPGHARPIPPFVDLPPQCVRFMFQDPQLPSGEQTVPPRSVDVRDAAVDDGRFGRTPDLGQVREERCEVLFLFLFFSMRMSVSTIFTKREKERTRNLPLSVSRRCLSTALCVARRSAVFARRLGLRFIALAVALLLFVAALVPCADALPAVPPGDNVGDCDCDCGSVLLLLLVVVPLLLLLEAVVGFAFPPPPALALPFEVGDAGCVSEVGESGSVIAIYSKKKKNTEKKKMV